MSASCAHEVVARLEKRAAEADKMIRSLRRQIMELRGCMHQPTVVELVIEENAKLTAEANALKSELIQLEISNGIKQVEVPVISSKSGSAALVLDKVVPKSLDGEAKVVVEASVSPCKGDTQNETVQKPKPVDGGQIKKNVKSPTEVVKDQENSETTEISDFGRLDLRVGLIASAKKHPDADSLYVEEVDVGDGGDRLRTVVSGLVRFIPLDEMQNRLAVLLCNLKPAKMRGVVSEAMVMCACTPDKIEVLRPPPGSHPGQRIHCVGIAAATPPDRELNPKKKVFERVAPDLKTDAEKMATYKGIRWTVEGVDGQYVVADTLKNVQIK